MQTTVGGMFSDTALRFQDRPCMETPVKTCTYAETLELAERTACALAKNGAKNGSRIAVWCKDSPEFLLLYLGLELLGSVPVLLNTSLTGAEVSGLMKKVEADIYSTYKPKMKKLTYSQGKLLIKLVNRECNSSSYDIVKAFMGPIRAGFWQAFAWAYGASLTKKYDPNGVDRLTERIVLQVEAGQL